MTPSLPVILSVLGAALVLATALVWTLRARTLSLSTRADATFTAKTDDGSEVTLLRYAPIEPRARELPIVLCHGFGANRFNLDFDDQYSFARYLRGRGYDVFVLELRGTGRGKRDQSFDQHVRYDVPAAIRQVLAVTGAEKVNWVGHSMGGMLMYAALPGVARELVHAVATVGSPATFAHQPLLRALARPYFWFKPVLRLIVPNGNELPARVFAPFVRSMGLPLVSALANLRNMETSVIRRALWNVVTNVSPNLLEQFALWAREGSGPAPLGVDDDSHWERIEQPMLFVAGAADWALAPPAAVKHAFYRVASARKEFVVASVATGFSADYGHGDLILGQRAPQEIFPLIERFLWAHRRADVSATTRVA